MKEMAKIWTIIGISAFVATVVIYFIAKPAVYPATVLGFAFLLYSELVFFGGLIIVEYWVPKSSEIITRAGAGISIGVYSLIVFLVSLIYMNTNTISVRGFLILQVLLFVAAFTIILVMGAFSRNISIKEKKALQADSVVHGYVDELASIRELTDKKSDMDKLIDGIRFSDTSVLVGVDVDINHAITNLKNAVKADKMDNSEFDKAVENIEFLIRERKLQISNVKQGGI